MKAYKSVIAVALFILMNTIATAQKPKLSDMANNFPGKVDGTIKKADSLMKIGKVLGDYFKPKSSSLSLIIAGVEMDDIRFQNLFNAVKNAKGQKRCTCAYDNNTATITCELKEKNKATFWMDLPMEVKTAFKTKSISDTAIVLEYKQSKADTLIAGNN